jgi:hypothetical protein
MLSARCLFDVIRCSPVASGECEVRKVIEIPYIKLKCLKSVFVPILRCSACKIKAGTRIKESAGNKPTNLNSVSKFAPL